jgi:hypothetical protein
MVLLPCLVEKMATALTTYEVELPMKVTDILVPRGGMSLSRPIPDPTNQYTGNGGRIPRVQQDKNAPVSGLDVVRDPLDKVSRVLGLNVLHLIVDLPHRNLSSEVGGDLVTRSEV